jgi:hypothetical protein
MRLFGDFARGYRDARSQHVPPQRRPSQPPLHPAADDDNRDAAALATLEGDLSIAKQTILELADALEQQQAGAAALQGELTETKALLADCEAILTFPGVRKLLINAFHPDKKRPILDSERAALNDMTAMILAVYDRLKTG